MRTAFVVSVLAFIVPVLTAPTLIPIVKRDAPVKQDSYIIKFKDAASKASALQQLAEKLKGGVGSSVTYDYSPLFNGIAATLKSNDLDYVRGMSGIEYIEPDHIVSLAESVPSSALDIVPPVAAGALVQRADGATNGQGVTVYGIDTGIYTEHSCFGGRAKWGATYGGHPNKDGNGHGTHTAATAVCNTYGVATEANIVAVKVLSDQGSGAMSDVAAGVQYAFDQYKAHGRPSVVTMSLGGLATDKALNQVVQAAIAGGLHFTVAAGNSNVPADTISPANVEEANTIGAVDSTKNNEKASFLELWKAY
ncbi:hypothetical protein OPQ81_001241 [Rhizoctonia solani]|nr:hypothetical protein OPQ81_001241 [Rhizoctonia solani]